MTTTLETMAVPGRRVERRIHQSVNDDRADVYAPGIITKTQTATNGALLARVRLDGQRSSLALPADYDGLRYLDQIVDVPELPMGPFTPTDDEKNGFTTYAGALAAPIGEDGEALVVVTTDLGTAEAAASAYAKATDLDPDYVDVDELKPMWAVFEWEPEESEYPWSVRWDATQGDDHAVHIYYLPPV
jgi:hypothetical protein